MRKTKAEAEQTREAILDAAERVFFERGIAGGTLEEIARVAGVTRGAVYWHFDNKLAIFVAISERAVLPYDDAMRQIETEATDDPLGVLERRTLSHFQACGADERVRCRLTVVMLRCDYVGEMAEAAERHVAITQHLSGQVERYFRDHMAPGRDAASWHAERLGRAFFNAMHGALMLWLHDPERFPLHGAGAEGVRLFVDLVRNRWHPGARSPI